MTKPTTEPKLKETEVRFRWPEDVHAIIRSHRRKLAAKKDSDVSFEEACIDYIRSTAPKS